MNFKKISIQSIISVILLITLLIPIFSVSFAGSDPAFYITGTTSSITTSSVKFKNNFYHNGGNWIFWVTNDAKKTPLYCINPGAKVEGEDGYRKSNDVQSDYFKNITNKNTTASQKEFLIKMILAKAPSTNYSSASNKDAYAGESIAIQVLIWEVICEDRNSNFNIINTTDNAVINITKNFDNNIKTQFNSFYTNYSTSIINLLKKIPIDGDDYTLKYNANLGKYITTISIGDNTMDECSFINLPNYITASINKTDNKITISSTKEILQPLALELQRKVSIDEGNFYNSDRTNGQEVVSCSKITSMNSSNPVGQITIKTEVRKGKIEINKKSANPSISDNNPHYSLKNAEYGIFSSNTTNFTKENAITTIKTDASGHASTNDNLSLGTYKIKELIAPKGYALDESIYTVTIRDTGNQTEIATCNLTDTPKTVQFQIIKYDTETLIAQGGATTTGGVFELYDSKGNLIETLNCGKESQVTTKKLPLDDYYIVKEVKAPEGYLIEETPLKLTFSEPNGTSALFTRSIRDKVIKGSITIEKYKTSTNESGELTAKEPFEGIEFQLKSKTKDKIYNSKETYITDKNGKVTFNDLPYDTYEIIEKTPEGYESIIEPKEIFVSENGKNYSIEIINKAKDGKLVINKKTDENKNISGIPFLVSGTTINGKSYTKTIETNAKGIAELILPYGEYEVKELESDINKFYIIPSSQKIKIEKEEIIELTFYNETQKGFLSVDKLIQEAPLKYTKGKNITFNISGTSYHGYEVNETRTSDENGLIVFSDIPVGEYLLTEIEDENNIQYIIQEPTNVKIVYDVPTTITINNDLKTCNIKIIKTQKERNDIFVADAEYTLFDKNEEIVSVGKTDENGQIVFENVPFGEYIIKETKAPFGYHISEEIIEVLVDSNGQTITFELEDELILKDIKIIKKCKETGNPLANTEFALYNTKTNEIVSTLKTNGDGIAVFYGIPYGEYTIKEITPPEGYVNDSIPITFVLDDEYDENTLLQFMNSPLPQTGIDNFNLILLSILSFLTLCLLFAFNKLIEVKQKVECKK